MSDAVNIVLPGEPIGKGRPRFVRATGVAYTPAPTRRYEDQLRAVAGLAMRGRDMLTGALEVDVLVFISVPQSWPAKKRQSAANGLIRPTSRPDADNYLKIACDSLNGIVYRDDSQITDVQIRKRYAFQPSLQIFVRQIEAAELMRERAA